MNQAQWFLSLLLLMSVHVKRDGNAAVADKLAHLARFSSDPQFWIEDIHCNAKHLVIIDRSFLSI